MQQGTLTLRARQVLPITRTPLAWQQGLLSQNSAGPVTGAFFAKISPAGDKLLYSGLVSGSSLTCSGGSSCFLQPRSTSSTGIALNASGDLYLAGNTNTTDLPASTNAYLAKGVGPFVARIDRNGTSFTLTYFSASAYSGFGGSPSDVNAIAIDLSGNLCLAGRTSDASFPVTPGSLQTALNTQPPPPILSPPISDAFVMKLAPDLSRIVWSTFLGGSAQDSAMALALDPAGTIWLAGVTTSTDFPNANGWTTGTDFLAGLNAAGSALTYSARFPGSSVSASVSAATSGFPHTAGSFGLVSTHAAGTPPASGNIFLVQNAAGTTQSALAPGEIISIFGPSIGPATAQTAAPSSTGFYPTTLGGAQVLVNGAAAPLLYASANQINAVVPLQVTGSKAAVQVTGARNSTSPFNMGLAPSAPGIFRVDSTHAVALNQDGTVNSSANPAAVGSVVAIWVTGVNLLDPALKDGQLQTGALNTFCCSVLVQYRATDYPYTGDAPGTITGLSQVNFKIPSDYLLKQVSVTVTSGNQWDTALIYVQ